MRVKPAEKDRAIRIRLPGSDGERYAVVGVDPGLSGGIAAIIKDGDEVAIAGVAGMPSIRADGALGRGKSMIDGYALIRDLEGLFHGVQERDLIPKLCVIERQFPKPGQALGSSFVSAFNYGVIWTACARAHTFVVAAEAHRWKNDLGLGPNKKQARDLATELFGEESMAKWWPRKGDHGPAEAVLIAWWRIRLDMARIRANPSG